ncbi:UNVERIFIED_ORG: patatin-like phospholipase family protein [Roseateles sp. XES5]|nr:patatin-like phospholipase family protein [Roseateles sp. XES5]
MADDVVAGADPRDEDQGAGVSNTPRDAGRKVQPQNFNTVFLEERREVAGASALETTAIRRKAEPIETGLALSGGGIRSAAFSLGVLQALKVRKVFDRIDFLSTVSGGGYTGAALVAGIKRGNGDFPFGMDDSTDRLGMGANEIGDNGDVRALRDKSRYLMPTGKFDLIVSLGIILRGLAVNAVMVAAAIFLAAAVTLFFNPTKASLQVSWINALLERTPFKGMLDLGPSLVLTKLLAIVLLLWLIGWALVRSAARSESDQSDPGSKGARRTGIFLLVILAVFLCEVQVPIVDRLVAWREGGGIFKGWFSFQTSVFTLVTGNVMLAFFWRKLVGYIQAADKNGPWRARFDKLVSGLALVLLAAALPLLIYVLYLWVTVLALARNGCDIPAVFVAVQDCLGAVWFLLPPLWIMLAIAHWSAKVGPVGETLLNGAWWKGGGWRQEDSRSTVAASLFLLILAVHLAGWLALHTGTADLGIYRIATDYLALFMVLFLVGSLFTENANSLHRLYRDRLNFAFNLGNGEKSYRLTDLATVTKDGVEQPLRPQLIINAAVNIQHSEHNKRARDADFFTFTPRHVGSEVTQYVSTEDYQKAEPSLDLATAVAISGAAVSSAMGRAGIALIAPTLALLNIRLAYWLRNPNRLVVGGDQRKVSAGDWRLPYLFFEMFKLLDEKSPKVYVSDGGHIDNLGLYQLLKRRCDVIVVSDAEADPAMTFASFVDVERFARIDLGIRMEVPVATIREAVLKRQAELKKADVLSYRAPAHAHAVIGKISYPALYEDKRLLKPAKEGVLLYIKASMTGDESTYVLDYEKRYPRFPHESTGDQFFSEEQFEAYRALGFHATSHGLKDTVGKPQYDSLRNKLQDMLDDGAKEQN